jgi:hypothetical protein
MADTSLTVLSMQKFKSVLGYGQRTNKFFIRFPEPFNGDGNDISYLVQSTNIPTKGIGTVVLPWQGINTRLPGDHEVSGTWTVTFRLDQENLAFKKMWSWLNLTLDSLSNSRAALADIIKIVEVQLLGPNLEVKSTFQILDMFPTEIGEISVDYEAENAITTWSVTFAYSDIAYNFS